MKLSELPSLKEGALSSFIAGATGYKRPTDNSMVTDFINKASKSIALKIQNGEISTAPTPIGGAGAFGQMAANLAQPSSTTSSAGQLTQTNTGQVHSASANNPNKPMAPAAPASGTPAAGTPAAEPGAGQWAQWHRSWAANNLTQWPILQ